MKEKYGVDITLVSSGQVVIYNGYLPGNKHAARRGRIMEEIYRETATDAPIIDGRYYLPLEIGGEDINEGCDFSMPTVKYIFQH